ncbi:hypothetical protein VNO77_19651 [Canavalia gladiata]|uniref:Secreted protein n=1 Tax=Canavalia gladiata TaxID=3824 RepID=A0AAN9LN05_CANGL
MRQWFRSPWRTLLLLVHVSDSPPRNCLLSCVVLLENDLNQNQFQHRLGSCVHQFCVVVRSYKAKYSAPWDINRWSLERKRKDGHVLFLQRSKGQELSGKIGMNTMDHRVQLSLVKDLVCCGPPSLLRPDGRGNSVITASDQYASGSLGWRFDRCISRRPNCLCTRLGAPKLVDFYCRVEMARNCYHLGRLASRAYDSITKESFLEH